MQEWNMGGADGLFEGVGGERAVTDRSQFSDAAAADDDDSKAQKITTRERTKRKAGQQLGKIDDILRSGRGPTGQTHICIFTSTSFDQFFIFYNL